MSFVYMVNGARSNEFELHKVPHEVSYNPIFLWWYGTINIQDTLNAVGNGVFFQINVRNQGSWLKNNKTPKQPTSNTTTVIWKSPRELKLCGLGALKGNVLGREMNIFMGEIRKLKKFQRSKKSGLSRDELIGRG